MKTLLIALLITTSVFAETITLLEQNVPASTYSMTNADAKFFMDTQTNQGFADITVTEYDDRGLGYPYPGQRCDRYGCYPMPAPMPTAYTIFRTRVEIPNLELVGKDIIFRGVEGDVKCGNLGTSRVLRRTTIYLTGNCKLKTYYNRYDLKVDFVTK